MRKDRLNSLGIRSIEMLVTVLNTKTDCPSRQRDTALKEDMTGCHFI